MAAVSLSNCYPDFLTTRIKLHRLHLHLRFQRDGTPVSLLELLRLW